MKLTVQTTLTALVVGLCICVAPVVSDQAFAQTTQTETKYVTVDGDVVRYDAGRVIVIRGADNKETAYTLSPKIVVPAEVRVGRRVTLYTELDKNGKTQLVSRVTTTSVTPEGNVKRTTEDTRRLPSGATTRTTTTNISGKVESYEAGRTLTITQSDGSKVTYLLNERSKVPADLVVGRTVFIRPLANPASDQPVAETITYVTTTTTTTTETVPQN
jgi:CHASE2 domain-containing sensor protein